MGETCQIQFRKIIQQIDQGGRGIKPPRRLSLRVCRA
jgi:hypothetical protein